MFSPHRTRGREGVEDRLHRALRRDGRHRRSSGRRDAFTEIVLRPTLTVPPGADRDRALRMLEKAKKNCLVSASVAAPVLMEPEIEEYRSSAA
jgi:organic hydroperoxide reductase OsmC/OhrA